MGHVNHCDWSVLRKPAAAPSVRVGYQAAIATPICALAAAMFLSAAATSGLLSSITEGTPTGMAGGATERGEKGSEKAAGGLPMRRATACSICARWTPTSISWAMVVLSCVSAWSTSPLDATPPLYLFCVSSRDLR